MVGIGIDAEGEITFACLLELHVKEVRRLDWHTLISLANAKQNGDVQLEQTWKGVKIHDVRPPSIGVAKPVLFDTARVSGNPVSYTHLDVYKRQG